MDLVCKKYINLLLFRNRILFVKQCLSKFISGKKSGLKLLSDLVIFSIFSSAIPMNFYKSIRVVPIFNVFFSCYKYYIILKYSWIKIFSSIKNTKFIYQIFVYPFVDIAYTFFDRLYNSYLFEFAYFSLAVYFSDVNLLNSWVVIYLSWSWSVVILFL